MRLIRERFRASLVQSCQLSPAVVLTAESAVGFRSASTDSSPQGGRNFQMLESTFVPVSTMLECETAMRQVRCHEELPDADHMTQHSEFFRLHNIMRKAAFRHLHVPTFLSSRCTGVFDKLQALLHSFSLEVPGPAGLVGWINSLGAWTVDMGFALSSSAVWRRLRSALQERLVPQLHGIPCAAWAAR